MNPRRLRQRRPRLAIAALLVSGFGGTCAFAGWSNPEGRGTGSASAAAFDDVVVEDAVVDGPLFPGAASEATIHITNLHAFPIIIGSASAGPVTSDRPGCDDSTAPTAVSLDVSGVTGTIPALSRRAYKLTVTMGHTAPAACQGALLSSHLALELRT